MIKKKLNPDDLMVFVATDVIQKMFEGENTKGTPAVELMKKMKVIKDMGGKMEVKTTLSHFLRAIYMLDPDTPVKNIQKVLSFTTVIPSFADFKNEKECIKEFMIIAKVMAKKGSKEVANYKTAQKMATEIFERSYGKGNKANIWVCHRVEEDDTFALKTVKIGNCDNCKHFICYDTALKHHMSKRAKKICPQCVLLHDKYNKYINKETREILEKTYGD